MFYVSQDVYNYLWRMADGPATLSVEDVQNDLGRTMRFLNMSPHQDIGMVPDLPNFLHSKPSRILELVAEVLSFKNLTKKMKQFYLHVAISSMVVGSGYTMVYLDLAGRFCR